MIEIACVRVSPGVPMKPEESSREFFTISQARARRLARSDVHFLRRRSRLRFGDEVLPLRGEGR